SSTVVTPAFLNTALGLGHPALTEDIKLAYKAPYSNSTHRGGIGGFVADIPVSEGHRSRSALRHIATSLSVTDKPALLLWGAKDPGFIDRYQHDLVHRIKNLDLQRSGTAGHLIAGDGKNVNTIR